MNQKKQEIWATIVLWGHGWLGEYFKRVGRIAIHPQPHRKLMVLAEISPKFESQMAKASWVPNKENYFTYTIRISIARILQRRLQQEVITSELQQCRVKKGGI